MNKGCLLKVIIAAVIGMVLLGIVLWGVKVYNKMVSLQEGVTSQWGNVETQYQRRADLIPNFVNTVKGLLPLSRRPLPRLLRQGLKQPRLPLILRR